MERTMNDNTQVQTMNCLDFIARYNKLKTLTTLKVISSRKKIREINKFNKRRHQREKRIITKTIRVKHTIEGMSNNENITKVRDFLREAERSFCSYIKHGERAKLKRRAIASANIILRMYLYIIEEFHLKLGKRIAGSTISIGGEEKKRKITTELCNEEARSAGIRNLMCQSTQDATKWNECLSSDLFALFHMVLFRDSVRDHIGIHRTTDFEQIFLEICLHGHHLLAIKKISLGESPIMESEHHFNRPPWEEVMENRVNKTFVDSWKLMEEKRTGIYMEASPGMLMGMHNALSTTVALAAVGYGLNFMSQSVATLRSSDDPTDCAMSSYSR
uniref:RNA-directed RNA polymerase catalytic subunit n=2 Tax=Cacopsylla melanoneura TaxID=428564 RepID=A0A8D8ZDC7_9HEMI